MYKHPDVEWPVRALTIDHFGLVLEDFDRAMDTLRAHAAQALYGSPVA